jgi:soluble lytic murein transglycosylase
MSARAGIILLFALLAMGLAAWWRYDVWRDHSQDQAILEAARRYGADPALVKAVVWRESRFDPSCRGRAGEIGLMQLRPAAVSEWVAAEHLPAVPPPHLLDPRTNLLAGTWYLKKLLLRYARADHPVPYALADYNAGRSRVLQWVKGPSGTNSHAFVEAISFPGTRAYVRSILFRYQKYRPVFPPGEER